MGTGTILLPRHPSRLQSPQGRWKKAGCLSLLTTHTLAGAMARGTKNSSSRLAWNSCHCARVTALMPMGLCTSCTTGIMLAATQVATAK